MNLLLATTNRGKQREWQALLNDLAIEWLLPDDVGGHLEIEESGETYAENALLKARAFAAAANLPALADDSGLEVDALDGAPGIRSARYTLGSDEVRYRALLAALDGIPETQRTARFRCVAALVLPNGQAFLAEGVCEGRITFAPKGKSGFGYDPVFWLPQLGRTMAELSPAEKNALSHRGKAAQALKDLWPQILAIVL